MYQEHTEEGVSDFFWSQQMRQRGGDTDKRMTSGGEMSNRDKAHMQEKDQGGRSTRVGFLGWFLWPQRGFDVPQAGVEEPSPLVPRLG